VTVAERYAWVIEIDCANSVLDASRADLAPIEDVGAARGRASIPPS
jgi:hypothetical protein